MRTRTLYFDEVDAMLNQINDMEHDEWAVMQIIPVGVLDSQEFIVIFGIDYS